MTRLLACVALLLAPALSLAHFPWLSISDEAYPRMHFGESLADTEYHLPESIGAAELWQSAIDAPAKKLAVETVEEDGFIGLEGEDPIEPRGRVTSQVVYGIYHGSKLNYYAQLFPAENPATWPQEAAKDTALQALMKVEGDKLLVTVLLNDEPLAGASATLSNEEGEKSVNSKTNDEGVAEFAMDAVHDGLNGVMVMHNDKEAKGDLDGQAFTSATNILTATFNYSKEAAAKVAALAPLPEAVSSFGAAVADGWLYVYGGHTGQAHDHSRDNLSKHFRRIRLDGEGGWEELATGPALQGLAVVAHGGKVYRIGGLDARNAAGEDADMHSVDNFASYDPQSEEWTDLAPLPQPRSSHNAVVIGDTLYVVGGWKLSGDSSGEWQAGAVAIDLADPSAGWRELPEPPFKHRALALSQIDGKVVALGGMNDEGDATTKVFCFDPVSSEWSEGPKFPGQPFFSFGLAAWNLDGDLYAGGMEGVLYRLSEDRKSWEKADKFATKRFFHQLVPAQEGGLLVIGGASPEVGHTATIELLDLEMPADAEDDEKDSEKTASFHH
jgi:N-acetylneuraminic acid mutarotase